MFARIALVSFSFAIVATAFSIGCSDAPVDGQSSNDVVRGGSTTPEGNDNNNNSANNNNSSNNNQGADAGNGKTSSGGSDSTTKDKDAGPEQPSTATPQCLAECESSGLRAKCALPDEDDFCEFACEVLEPQERTCLLARPSCTKADFVACQPPGEPGGGGKNK